MTNGSASNATAEDQPLVGGDEALREECFCLPSTALFLGLIPVFSGQARRGDLARTLLDQDRQRMDPCGNGRATEVRTYIVYAGRDSEARTSVSLFSNDPLWQEGELSALIRRQFGPAGLKHLLGVFIAAEEQSGGMPGSFIFDANRHLDILGYPRSNRVAGKRYHTTKHLSEAREIVALLCSLTLVQEIRCGTRKGNTVRVRLLMDEASAQSWEEVVIDGEQLRQRIHTNEKLFLRINPHLYSLAAEGTRVQQYFYTHQLKKLSRENAHSQALTLTLGVHLPIRFRLQGCQPLKYPARGFLQMAGLPPETAGIRDQCVRLERSMRYMVDQGYLSAFSTPRYRYARPRNQATPLPPAASGAVEPPQMMPLNQGATLHTIEPAPPGNAMLDEPWVVEPPEFLTQLLSRPLRRMEQAQSFYPAAVLPLAPAEAVLPLPAPASLSLPPPSAPGRGLANHGELLRQLRTRQGLSQGQLAGMLSVTQAAVSMAEGGKRPQMAQRLYLDACKLFERPAPPEVGVDHGEGVRNLHQDEPQAPVEGDHRPQD